MPINLNRSTYNPTQQTEHLTPQDRAEARDALIKMRDHLQGRIDNSWLPPGVLRVHNLNAPSGNSVDPGIKVTRDRWYHMFSRSSTRGEASANYVRGLLTSTYRDRLTPEKFQALIQELDNYLANHGNQLGARTFVELVNRFEKTAIVDITSAPPTQERSEVIINPSQVETSNGVISAGMEFRAGSKARECVQRELQKELIAPTDKGGVPLSSGRKKITDPLTDARLDKVRSDLARQTLLLNGNALAGSMEQRLEALVRYTKEESPDDATADNCLRELAQILQQGTAGTLSDTPELSPFNGQEGVKMPWAGMGSHGPAFEVRRDPDNPTAFLISLSSEGRNNLIIVGQAAHSFGAGEDKPVVDKLEMRLRYTPSSQAETAGRIEVLDIATSYRIDQGEPD